jgi:hypothetical protein
MSAVNVARTDTFEQQRVKINTISTALFNVTSGGSDLSTGNLKLGDGTLGAPSLAFVNEDNLGIYRPAISTFGFAAGGKKITDIGLSSITSFQNIIVQQKKLLQSGISIQSVGSNYDTGSYTDIAIVGGSGQFGTLDIEVTAWNGAVTNLGSQYYNGSFTSVPLLGGNGNGATANFEVDPIDGTIDDGGTAYKPGTYTGVPLTGGNGSGAEATVDIQGGASLSGTITQGGTGYVDGNYAFVQLFNTPTQTFVVTAIANPNAGNPGEPNYIYAIDGNTQPSLTMVEGNTYRFDMSDTSLDPSNGADAGANHRMTFQMADGSSPDVNEYEFFVKGAIGTTGAFQDLIVKPGATTGTNAIRYDCANHQNMAPAGGNITVNTGAAGSHGVSAYADITISGQAVTNIVFIADGSGYKSGDVLQISNLDVGNAGSGFEFTASGIVLTGVVTTVTITQSGTGYQTNDVLGINDSDVGSGGTGSGFQYTITSQPGIIKNFAPAQKGTGYQVGDVLSLGQGVTNISAYAPGQSISYATTLSISSASFTISDTSALQVGMYAASSAGDTGSLDPVSTIQSIDSATQVTLDIVPLGGGTANIVFTTQNLFQVTVPDTTGMNIDDIVEKVSGAGILDSGTTVANVDDATTITLSSQPTTAGPIVLSVLPPYGNPADDFEYTINSLGAIDTITINGSGNGYAIDDILSVSPSDLTQPLTILVTAKYVQTVSFTQTIASGWVSAGDSIKEVDGVATGVTAVTTPDKAPDVTGPLTATLNSGSAVVTLSSTTGINIGDIISENASGNIPVDPTVVSVDSATQITMSAPALQTATPSLSFTSDEAATYSDLATTGGTGSGCTVDVTRNSLGQVTQVVVNQGGVGYTAGETLTVSGTLTGGTSPTHDITVDVAGATSSTPGEVISVTESGGNITSILVETDQGSPYASAQSIIKSGTTSPIYTIDTASSTSVRFYIDPDGNGAQLTPNLTLYAGSTYRFDLSDQSLSGTQFNVSTFADGFNSPSRVAAVSTSLDNTSRVITVASTAGIAVGMILTKDSGDGELESDTRVESVDSSTQITLTQIPTTSGATVVTFAGAPYTDGVTTGAGFLDLKITNSTPSLYYFDNGLFQNAGGADGNEAVITIDPNNPKVFGSGFQLRVVAIQESDVITSNVLDGTLSAVKVVATTGEIDSIIGTDISVSTTESSVSVTTPLVTNSTTGPLTLTGTSIDTTNNFTVGLFSVDHATGDVLTSGELQALTRLNVNNKLFITDNVISTDASSDLILTAPTGRVTQVTGFGALTIPSGNTTQRPSAATNGSIRFNTQTNQYEGYSAGTSSWSSLGGVRDLDGNTYILAEKTVGANDNTLWFYNDDVNTIKVTPSYFELASVKKIRSLNTTAPAFTEWSANTPVLVGDYIKYKNNLYEVTTSGGSAGDPGGTTASSGNEPTHTSGVAPNGTTELTWSQLAVDSITFEDVSEIRVGPQSELSLSINNDLRFANNVISSDISDLLIRPNSGKKIICDSATSLVVPAGADADRGVAIQGSVRFSSTSSQFEGYDGANWGSLGGVKDVDQNTYIIPETSPGANENTLYFYNDGAKTLEVTTTALDFYGIDTIRSVTSDELEITASLLTFDSGTSTFDNTQADRTFLHTTKQYFDLGLSAGLTTDPVLRLDDQGDVFLNVGFGSGNLDLVKIFDGDLKEFELADVRVLSEKLSLVKGTTNNGSSELYPVASNVGCKTTVIAHNTVTQDKEFFEFGVLDDGTNIFHTTYGNIRTGIQLIIPTFEVTGTGAARLNIELGADVNATDTVTITIVSNVTKK